MIMLTVALLLALALPLLHSYDCYDTKCPSTYNQDLWCDQKYNYCELILNETLWDRQWVCNANGDIGKGVVRPGNKGVWCRHYEKFKCKNTDPSGIAYCLDDDDDNDDDNDNGNVTKNIWILIGILVGFGVLLLACVMKRCHTRLQLQRYNELTSNPPVPESSGPHYPPPSHSGSSTPHHTPSSHPESSRPHYPPPSHPESSRPHYPPPSHPESSRPHYPPSSHSESSRPHYPPSSHPESSRPHYLPSHPESSGPHPPPSATKDKSQFPPERRHDTEVDNFTPSAPQDESQGGNVERPPPTYDELFG